MINIHDFGIASGGLCAGDYSVLTAILSRFLLMHSMVLEKDSGNVAYFHRINIRCVEYGSIPICCLL